jgi:hypothetical protein
MMHKISLVTCSVLLAACSEREFNVQNIPPPAGDLRISGQVCHPLTGFWLEDALVYTHLYDSQDVVYDSRSDYTDADGSYELRDLVADRPYEIYVQLGQNVIDKFVVELAGEDLELPAPACAEDVSLDVAVITGAYDELEPMLQAIGVTGVHLIDGQAGSEIVDFLTDPLAMSEFDILFFDGGHREDGVIYGTGPTEVVRDSLRSYVQQGGVIFASDWAYDVIETAWPDAIDFYGDDAVPDAAQVGEATTLVAEIVEDELAENLDRDELEITYDLPVWPVVESASDSVDVYLRGDAPWRRGFETGTTEDSPLLLAFDDGEGRVMFTTYRNSANNTAAGQGVLLTLMDAF